MATLREYFDTDPRTFTIHSEWTVGTLEGQTLATIIAKVAYEFEGNAKYWYFFIPENGNFSACLAAILNSPAFSECKLSADGDGVQMQMGHSDYSERQSTDTLQFTKRVHIYMDCTVSLENRKVLVAEVLARGYFLSIRDREYAQKRSESEKPLAFISHDSRDKDGLVRDLARELIAHMCPVWYDEYSLNVGDSLRACIEKGLKECRKCIIVLSPNFLANSGWSKAEFDSIFTREILQKENIILPVWHNVGINEVYEYSPRLADKIGLPSTLGAKELAIRLSNEVKRVAKV